MNTLSLIGAKVGGKEGSERMTKNGRYAFKKMHFSNLKSKGTIKAKRAVSHFVVSW